MIQLEGAVLAGEGRVKAQAAELEGLKEANRQLEEANRQLEQELAAAQAQVGVTPDRARAERQRLAQQAAEAQAAAEEQAARADRLAAALALEVGAMLPLLLLQGMAGTPRLPVGQRALLGTRRLALVQRDTALLALPLRAFRQARQHGELAEFASLEHRLLSDRERALAAEAAQLRADVAAAAAQLAAARQRLVDGDSALLGRDEEVRQLRGELEAAQAAAGAAAAVTAEWRQRAEAYDRDRQTAAENTRRVVSVRFVSGGEGGPRWRCAGLLHRCQTASDSYGAAVRTASGAPAWLPSPAVHHSCPPLPNPNPLVRRCPRRKAERELEMVAQDNERMFRQVSTPSWHAELAR